MKHPIHAENRNMILRKFEAKLIIINKKWEKI